MRRFLKFVREPAVAGAIGGLLVFLSLHVLRAAGALELLELAAYDALTRVAPGSPPAAQRITLIEVTEDDIQELGRWPLTDEVLARAAGALLRDEPRAIGLDIYRDILVPPGSAELNRVLAEEPRIIGVTKFGEKGVQAPAILGGTEQVGFNDILVDPGGIVRRGLMFLDDGEEVYASLALRLAVLYLRAEGIEPRPDPANPQHIRLDHAAIRPLEGDDGGYVDADARGYQYLLDFRDARFPFPSFSLMDLLAGNVPPEAVREKVVIIGVGAQSVKDFFYTPLSRGFDEAQQVPGVVLHGYMTSQLLRFALDGSRPIASPPADAKALWLLAWSVAGALAGLSSRSVWRFAALTGGGLAILCCAAYGAFVARWWIPLVPPAIAFATAAVVVTAYMTSHEKRERTLLMQIFSRHVSKEIAEAIWQQRDKFLNDGRPRSQKLTATVLFSDMRGFTSVSEKMDPKELIDWLNLYLESMAQLIMDHGGVVDDYAGDGIKANFGVPIPRGDEEEVGRDAVNAVTCALAMEREMARLNAGWSAAGLPAMGVRVGIFTGPVVAGLLGNSRRLKYTTVGDTVNVAARLESYDKEVGKERPCRILIGESTLHHVGSCFTSERIGALSLKGKQEKITVYQVLGEERRDRSAMSQAVEL